MNSLQTMSGRVTLKTVNCSDIPTADTYPVLTASMTFSF